MAKKKSLPTATVIENEEQLVKVQFCVPPLGTEIILAKDWTFKLYEESRNWTLLKALNLVDENAHRYNYWSTETTIKGDVKEDGEGDFYVNVTIPKGSKLSVSRIYIRNGAKKYDSITFYLKKYAGDSKIKGRFWAKLHDVNQIVCFPIGTDVETKEVFMGFGSSAKDFKFIDI